MNSVANNGGHVKLKNIQITSSQNIAIKSTDEGTISVDGAKITDSVSHAVCVEKNSIVKVLNTEIDTTGKSSVYVANSKLTMEDTRIKNAPNYGIYAKECDKTKEQGVFLDRITIDKSNDRGIGNSNSWVVVKNTKISDTKGAAIYTEKESTITNIHELTVNTPGSCGLGLLGGTVTARNVTITNAVKEGVNIGKGTDVRLDNVTVVSPGGHGVGNYGGTLNITVDMDFNPENLLHNGLTVTDAGESGIYCGADSKTTAIGVAIENSKAHAVCAMNESYLSLKQSKIDKTGKSSVYVKASKAVLTDVAIVNSPNYGVYATACEKDKDQGAFLEGVTIDKAGERGIGNSGAWVVIKNTTIR